MPFFLAPLIVGGAVYYVKRRKGNKEEGDERTTEEKLHDNDGTTDSSSADDYVTKTECSTASSEALPTTDRLDRKGKFSKINRFLWQPQGPSIQTTEGSDTFRMMDKEIKLPKISYK